MGATVAKRLFLRVMIAATVLSALYAIAVFLGGHFSHTSQRILATTLLLALSSSFCLACSAVWERTPRLAMFGISGAVLSFPLVLIPLWGHPGDLWGKSAFSVYVASAACTYAALLEGRHSPDDSRNVSVSRRVGAASVFALAALLILLIFSVIGSSGWGRLAGVLAVLLVGSTLLGALLRRLQRIDAARIQSAPLSSSPRAPSEDLVGQSIVATEPAVDGRMQLVLADGRRLTVIAPAQPFSDEPS